MKEQIEILKNWRFCIIGTLGLLSFMCLISVPLDDDPNPIKTLLISKVYAALLGGAAWGLGRLWNKNLSKIIKED